MTACLEFSLPFPVSVNAAYAHTGPRRHKSQKYADWLQEAGWELKSLKLHPIHGPVAIEYTLQEGQDRRERDLANFEKVTTDLLVSQGVIDGDSNKTLRELHLYWSREVEGIRVRIWSTNK